MLDRSLDSQVRASLKKWPQRPPGISCGAGDKDAWLRGRPTEVIEGCHPFLKIPGADRFRTLPDGLWLNFGGRPVDPFVDIFAIEACGSLQNLLDKRSRFAPSTHSLLAFCPLPWLLGPVMEDEPVARWEVTGLFKKAPIAPLIVPVRDIRVMYGLKARHYAGFSKTQVPHPHEYFVPMDALIAEDGDKDPQLQALVSRASARANFFSLG